MKKMRYVTVEIFTKSLHKGPVGLGRAVHRMSLSAQYLQSKTPLVPSSYLSVKFYQDLAGIR